MIRAEGGFFGSWSACVTRWRWTVPASFPKGVPYFSIEPGSVFDPELDKLSTVGLSPRRVVLEITERAAVKDYGLFRRHSIWRAASGSAWL